MSGEYIAVRVKLDEKLYLSPLPCSVYRKTADGVQWILDTVQSTLLCSADGANIHNRHTEYSPAPSNTHVHRLSIYIHGLSVSHPFLACDAL